MNLVNLVFPIPVKRSYIYRVPDDWEPIPVGCRVTAPLGRRNLTGYSVKGAGEAPDGIELKFVQRRVDSEPLFDEEYLALAEWVAERYLCSLGEALSAMLPGARREQREEAGVLVEEPDAELRHTLTADQQEAVETLWSGSGSFYYLHGVTGSGKTEVYLRVAEKVLEQGRGVIYLVPEISLTYRLSEELAARFGPRVALLHSGLTPSRRLREWRMIQSRPDVLVVGARSAVFAPVKDPGLVILDEEHEGAYKSGHKPRYHARQVAMHRIRLSEGKLIMGSATPSVEAYHLALEGRLKRIELPSRVAGGTPPNIELVDMRKEKGSVSKRLLEELHAVRGRGGQSILFLNRRGFSYFFHCKSCGYQQLCSNCSVPMTYHKDRDRMICHYCGHVERPLTICPVCGSHDTGYSGFGTERVEEDLHRLLPDFHIARLDTDAARKRGEGARILREMAEGKIDILLGTQMVAKGLDFPSVKLVGVVLADTGLHLPDFRAAERTFSLITQVAGRAGRRSSDGKVLVQTFLPNNPTIQMAVTGDTGSFYDNERRLRSELLFPPFVRMARIVLRGRSSGRVYKAAEQLAGLCREEAQREEAEVEILGPAECPLAVLSGNYRYHLILRSQSFSALHRTVRNGDTRLQRVSGVFEEIDMDPVSLL